MCRRRLDTAEETVLTLTIPCEVYGGQVVLGQAFFPNTFPVAAITTMLRHH